ncbi:hypothetical protein Trco_002120 [Trichoderma cornu-damae]|uniref:Uncharacterized protein n=1 Tax=Trichoderma cornu-damae TaxID=654480 RepID=A0A9P8QP87_9HYPO|nr:hypothetical protein Trco_002120 [Trichoderma cornu-damae]
MADSVSMRLRTLLRAASIVSPSKVAGSTRQSRKSDAISRAPSDQPTKLPRLGWRNCSASRPASLPRGADGSGSAFAMKREGRQASESGPHHLGSVCREE